MNSVVGEFEPIGFHSDEYICELFILSLRKSKLVGMRIFYIKIDKYHGGHDLIPPGPTRCGDS